MGSFFPNQYQYQFITDDLLFQIVKHLNFDDFYKLLSLRKSFYFYCKRPLNRDLLYKKYINKKLETIDIKDIFLHIVDRKYKREYDEIAKVLIPILVDKKVNLSTKNNLYIRRTSIGGYKKAVKLLLRVPEIDPAACDNEAIRISSSKGHLEVVYLLLSDSRVDPTAYNNYAFEEASYYGHLKVKNMLYRDLRVRNMCNERFKKFQTWMN